MRKYGWLWFSLGLLGCGSGEQVGITTHDLVGEAADAIPDHGQPPPPVDLVELQPLDAKDAEAADVAEVSGCRSHADCAFLEPEAGPCQQTYCDAATGQCSLIARSAGAPCDDADPCTADTACREGQCQLPVDVVHPCDDGNPCTDDRCDPALPEDQDRCVHEPNEASCDDGLACTQFDQCAEGRCLGAVTGCDDQNPCTNDLCSEPSGQCQHTFNTGPCSDHNACTANDVCREGSCRSGVESTCDDGNLCTNDICNSTVGCRHDANALPCDDGNPCSDGDQCESAQCKSGAAYTCPDCAADADCTAYDDGNPCNGQLICYEQRCTVDPATVVVCPSSPDGCSRSSCVAATGLCQTEPRPEGQNCDDGDPCTLADACTAGVCVGQPAHCDDGNPCTQDGCQADVGCLHTPADDELCDDGDECTNGDSCRNGVCLPGLLVCVPCAVDDNCAALQDDDLCNGQLTCQQGTCRFAQETVVVCDTSADTVCQQTRCDPATGQCETERQPTAAPCDDGLACTVGDGCQADGQCLGTPRVCDDQNPCTADGCDPATGQCAFVPADDVCEDGDLCTGPDLCNAGTCLAGPAIVCDDHSPCTADSCNPASGCVFDGAAATGTPCDDHDLCSDDDRCQPDGRCSGVVHPCGDDNPCTDDLCDSLSGTCVYPFNSNDCEDGQPCTVGDHCQQGTCAAGPPPTCQDDNICTDDSCDPASGCRHVDNSAPCDDSNACTLDDTCNGGQCTGGGARSCVDDNECTQDGCDPATGCTFAPSVGPCDDDDPCTLDDACSDGNCAGGATDDCDDGNPCTDDPCIAGVGCDHVYNTAGCSDGNSCTEGDICQQGQCRPGTVTCHEQLFADGCTDGVDNDTDSLTDCDDPDCEPVHPCTPINFCQPAAVLDCGDSGVPGSLLGPGTTDAIDHWGCWVGADAAHGSSEYAYGLQWSCYGSVHVQVQTTSPGAGSYGHALLDVFILDGARDACYPESCVAVGQAADTSVRARADVTFPALAQRQYFVVVDGRNGDSGAYTISVQCTPQYQMETCTNGVDDDCDGLTDCDDYLNCGTNPACP